MKKSLINSSFHTLFWFYVPVVRAFQCIGMNIIAVMRLSRYKSKQTDLALKGFVICIYECSDKLSNDWIWLRCFLQVSTYKITYAGPSEIGSSVEGDHYVIFFKIYSKFLLIRNQSSVLNFFSQFSSSFLVVKQGQISSLFALWQYRNIIET